LQPISEMAFTPNTSHTLCCSSELLKWHDVLHLTGSVCMCAYVRQCSSPVFALNWDRPSIQFYNLCVKRHFNILLPFLAASLKWTLPFRFFQLKLCICFLSPLLCPVSSCNWHGEHSYGSLKYISSGCYHYFI
jgi:hypothetical protein